MKRRALGILVLLFLALPAAAGEVPLIVHGGALLVEATLNGRFTGRFLLDTGATYCVVSREVARQAKVRGRTSGETVRLLTVNGPVDANLGEVRKVELGGDSARDVEVAVMDDDPAPGLDGLIGLSFLDRFTYTVDRENATLRLDRP
jgi:clan AA aspartic protease (TIGR02281 family)